MTERTRVLGLLLIAFVAFLSMPLGSEGAHTVSSVLPALRSSAADSRPTTGTERTTSARSRSAARPHAVRFVAMPAGAVALLVILAVLLLPEPSHPIRGGSLAGRLRCRAPPAVA